MPILKFIGEHSYEFNGISYSTTYFSSKKKLLVNFSKKYALTKTNNNEKLAIDPNDSTSSCLNNFYYATRVVDDSWKQVVQIYLNGHAWVPTNFFKITDDPTSKVGLTKFIWKPNEIKTLYVIGKAYTAPNVRDEKKFSVGVQIKVKNENGKLMLEDVIIRYQKYLNKPLADLSFSIIKDSTKLYKNNKDFVHIENIFKKETLDISLIEDDIDIALKKKIEGDLKIKKNNDNYNGKSLVDEIIFMTKFNLSLIDKLNRKDNKEIIKKLIKNQSDILTDYLRDAIKRERWNKLFRLFQRLIYLSIFLFFSILAIIIVSSTEIAFELNDSFYYFLLILLVKLIIALDFLILKLLEYLGIKRK